MLRREESLLFFRRASTAQSIPWSMTHRDVVFPRFDWGQIRLCWVPLRIRGGALITSLNPARVGPAYSIWLTGLGPSISSIKDGLEEGGVALDEVPVYNYPGTTQVVPNILYIGNSVYPGLNQINFTIPNNLLGDFQPLDYAPFPCGDYSLELLLTVQTQNSFHTTNFVSLPVVVKPGDVICSN